MNTWTIKAIYPQGGHIVRDGNEAYRFTDKQAATDKVEAMNALEKSTNSSTRYIVVLEN